MDYPIHTDTIGLELSILYLKGFKISINDVYLSLKIVFISANSADLDVFLTMKIVLSQQTVQTLMYFCL